MKRTLLSACIAMTSFAAFAQPTLTSATNAPVAGDKFVAHYFDTAGVTWGASGASATWNFGSVTATSTDTATFMSCASTPFCDSFSGANLASFDGSDYTYVIANTAAITAIGAHSDTDYIHFIDPKVFMKFPFTYNNMFVDTSIVPLFGPAQMRYIDSNFADAYGTLILPTGTYNNVLRIHTKTTQTITVSGMPFSSAATETYGWYAPGFHSPLVMLNVDTAGSGTPYVNEARYYTGNSSSTGIGNATKSNIALSLSPNPATDVLHISFDLQQNTGAMLEITDMTGKVVYTSADLATGANNIAFVTSSLQSGMYILHLHAENGVSVAKFSVVK